MTKAQKTFFIIATVLCIVALVFGVLGIYFGVSAAIAIASPEPSDSIGGAFLLVVMILFTVSAGCFLVASLPFYAVGPLRAPRCTARRVAWIMLIGAIALFLANVALFAVGYLMA